MSKCKAYDAAFKLKTTDLAIDKGNRAAGSSKTTANSLALTFSDNDENEIQ